LVPNYLKDSLLTKASHYLKFKIHFPFSKSEVPPSRDFGRLVFAVKNLTPASPKERSRTTIL